MTLSTNEVINLTNKTIKDYNLEEEEKHFNIIKDIYKRHGNQPFYIYHYLSFGKNLLILSKVASYIIEIPLQKENYFLNRLKDTCFIEVLNKRTDKTEINNQHVDDIFYTIKVFR